MRFVIHIMRETSAGQAPDRLESFTERCALVDVRVRALDRLWRYSGLDQDDYVLVREAASGREVFRWYLRQADAGNSLAGSSDPSGVRFFLTDCPGMAG